VTSFGHPHPPSPPEAGGNDTDGGICGCCLRLRMRELLSDSGRVFGGSRMKWGGRQWQGMMSVRRDELW
jgi:hypothetical protein